MVDPDVEIVTLMWPTQVGKTTLEFLAFLYLLYFEPKNYLWAFPDDRLLDRWWREKFVKFVEASPIIVPLIRHMKYGTLEFVGGLLETATSTAPSSLTSFTARLAFIDELDKWSLQPDSDDVRTSVISRGSGFGEMFRLVEGSTPHGKTGSYIFGGYKAGSQFQFQVPCYHRRCREMQLLSDETLENDKLHCRYCGRPWSDRQRWEMICHREAEWVSYNTGFDPAYRSYHVNSFYSPVPLATTLKRAPGDPRGYSAQVMGWPYEDEIEAPPEPHELERFFTPDEIDDPSAIILAVDVQKDRLEYMITHWDRMFPRVVTQNNFRRQAAALACWEELDALVTELRPDFTVIDRSKFDGTDVVESVTAVLGRGGPRAKEMLRHRRIRLIKGIASAKGPDMISSRNDKLAEWNINPTQTKLGVHRLLQLDQEAELKMSVRRDNVPRNFIDQLLAEKYMVRYVQGRPVEEWTPPKGPNESLDLLGYSLAGRYELGLTYRRRQRRREVFPIMAET